jgi:hypothetical protein
MSRRPNRGQLVAVAAGALVALLAVVTGRALWHLDTGPVAAVSGASAPAAAGGNGGSGAAAARDVTVRVDGAQWRRPAVTADRLAGQVGARITQVAVTGGGGLVDLRFQVVDPDRAAALHDPQTPSALIDEANGVVVDRLLMNHAHAGPFNAGETYYLVFENPGSLVRRGDAVTVLLGGVQVEHVRIG